MTTLVHYKYRMLVFWKSFWCMFYRVFQKRLDRFDRSDLGLELSVFVQICGIVSSRANLKNDTGFTSLRRFYYERRFFVTKMA